MADNDDILSDEDYTFEPEDDGELISVDIIDDLEDNDSEDDEEEALDNSIQDTNNLDDILVSDTYDPGEYVPYTDDSPSNIGAAGEDVGDEQETVDIPVDLPNKVKSVTVTLVRTITEVTPELVSEVAELNARVYAVLQDGTRVQCELTDVFTPGAPAVQRYVNQGTVIAAAINQHFWHNSEGAHVTDDTQDDWNTEYEKTNHGELSSPTVNRPWHNILMNSYGFLIRQGLLWLSQQSVGATVFYDGLGNTVNNILASFGSDGVQIGKLTEKHVEINDDGLTVYDENGDIAPVVAHIDGGNINGATLTNIPQAAIVDLDADYAHLTNGVIDNAKIGYADVNGLNANYAHLSSGVIDNAKIGHADVNGLNANYAHLSSGVIDNAKIDQANVNNLSANYAHLTSGVIDNAKIGHADVNGLNANYAHLSSGVIDNAKIDQANVNNLSANYAHLANGIIDNATIDQAKVNNLSTHYAEITNGHINSALIDTASIVDEQVFTVTGNKATISEINADNITVRNLNAKNLKIETANGMVNVGGTQMPTKAYLDSLQDTLQQEIDGAVETFTSTAVPLLTNYPASGWVTSGMSETDSNKALARHVGDICYVQNASLTQNGYAYRFAYDSTSQTFSWVLIKDSDVTKALGDISNLQSFQSDTSTWIDETEQGLTAIRQNHTALSGIVDKTVKSSIQLWFSKANTTAPNKPTSQVTSTSTAGNAWRIVVPAYNASYPNYFYCWQYQFVDDTYGWSSVVRDIAMGEAQQQGRQGISDAAAAKAVADAALPATTFTTFEQNTFQELVDEVDEQSSTITTLSTKTQRILDDIGSRNLILGSEHWSEWTSNAGATINGNELSYTTNTVENCLLGIPVRPGETLTLSVDVKENTEYTYTSSGNAMILLDYSIADTYRRVTYAWMFQTVTVTTEWQRISETFTVPSTETIGQVFIRLRNVSSNPPTYYMRYMKLERGDIATDWSAAPEDIEASLTVVSNTVNSVVQTANTNSATITQLTTTLGTNADGTTKDNDIVHRTSSIEQDLDSFQTSVSETYATKTEAKQSAQPNLSPWFSALPYTVNNPAWAVFQTGSGYIFTPMGDGWMRVQCENTGSSTLRKDFYAMYNLSILPNHPYTWLVELRNNHSTGTTDGTDIYMVAASYGQFQGQANVRTLEATEGVSRSTSTFNLKPVNLGEAAFVRKLKLSRENDDNWSTDTTAIAAWTCRVAANSSIDYEVRISVYEGEYWGPYKPYVEELLSYRLTSAETAIQQNQDSITLSAKRMETFDGNMLYDTDVPNISRVYGPADRYWSDTGNTMISCSIVEISDPPVPGIQYAARFVCDGTNTSPKDRALAFYNTSNDRYGDTTYLPMVVGQSYVVSWWARCTAGLDSTRTYISYRYKETTSRTDGRAYLTNEWKQYTAIAALESIPTDYIRVWFYANFLANTAGTIEMCGFRMVADTFATSAELKVANDSILTKVEKDGVISSINQSSESITIDADRVNISGAAIFTSGALKKVVTATQNEWYSSTSATSLSGGSWATTQPSVATGRYIWTREKVTYSDGTSEYKPSQNGVCTQGQTDLSAYSTTSQANNLYDSKGSASTVQNNLDTEVSQRKAIFAKSTTAAGTAAKVTETNTPAGFVLYSGATVSIQFTTANTATTPTLNVNGTGAKTIRGYTGAALTAAEYKWAANAIITFTYDGTYWRMQDGGALQAKADAAASASTASSKATDALNSATAASNSASTASTKATEASNSASTASTKATEASNSASTASTKATEASNSASTASTKATEASNSASTASTKASEASTSASNAATSAQNAADSATAAAEVMGGYTILWNYSSYNTRSGGEAQVTAYDPLTGVTSPGSSWVKFKGIKRTISGTGINPNTILPYNIPIYIVYRLSSADATSGTHYMVWYNSGWKYAITPTPTAVGGDWTWVEATDIILGKFVEPASEAEFTDCEIFNPPATAKQVTTDTVTARGAYSLATTANNTANNAAPKTDAVSRTQRIWYRTNAVANLTGPTTWVTANSDVYNSWTTKCPPIAGTVNTGTETKYPYLYTCMQTQTVSQAANNGTTCTASAVLLDDSTTVIDGGNIITGTVTANKLNATDINANGILTIGAFSSTTQDNILNENVVIGGRNLAFEGNVEVELYINGSNNDFSYRRQQLYYTTDYGLSLLADTNNEYFTVSFDYISKNFDTVATLVLALAHQSGAYSSSYPYKSNEGASIPVGNSSGHYSLTFTPLSSHRSFGNRWMFMIYDTVNNRNAELTIYNFKFELGNRETGFSIAPENFETLNNPNILPYFSVDSNDSNYWHTFEHKNESVSTTEGIEACYVEADGWAHIIEDTRVESGNANKTGYQNFWLKTDAIIPYIKPNTTYTVMVEIKDMVGYGIAFRLCNGDATLNAFNSVNTAMYSDGVYYQTLISKSDFSALTRGTRGYFSVSTEHEVDFRARVSMYEGRYSGPYKPYVGKLLYPSNTELASTNSTLNTAVIEEQYIYIQAVSGTNSVSQNTTWVTATGESTTSDTTGLTPVWTTKRPTYRSNYPVIFIAKQKKTVAGTVTCSTPIKDDTLTIIDGGHITTGTIDASKATITNIDASKITVGQIKANQIDATDLNASNSLTIGAFNSETQTTITNAAKRVSVDISVTAIDYDAQTATLQATLYIDGSPTTSNVTYVWYKNGTVISGQTARTLSVTSAMGLSNLYTCTVTY